MKLGLFANGGWNSIDIGFTLSSTTMIATQFSLTLYVGATRILEHSINTNLPALNGTSPIRCTYLLPLITCTPIDAFTSTSTRYYIRFKAFFSSTDSITNLGSISISLPNPSQLLFTPLTQNLAIPMITSQDYHDYSGYHSTNHQIHETQVISAPDSGLANATSTFMNGLFISNTFIGIDPSISNQQLLFLLATTPSQTYTANPN